MIPLKLQLKNFVSYGSITQVIDFVPYQLICLSGKNGHGKSALLDALTWALWGQARKTSGVAKADDGLLRLGQTHMMVSLDFSCNNTIYRVRREYTYNASKPFTSLDFGIVDPTSGLLRPLTDKTVRVTQQKIETMIGLDYESFINSAFLRQGQSNEFSKKSPKDRKEILATILGLDQFERLRKLATERVKDAVTQREYISKQHEHCKQELAQKEVTVQRLNELQQMLIALQTKEAAISSHLQVLKEQFQEVAEMKIKTERIGFQKEQLTSTIAEQTRHIYNEIAVYRRVIHEQRTLNYKQLEEEKNTLQSTLLTLQEQGRKSLSLKEKIIVTKEAQRAYLQILTEKQNKNVEQYKFALQHSTLQLQTLKQDYKAIELRIHKEQEEHTKLSYELAALMHTTTSHAQELLAQEEKLFERRKAYYHEFIAKGNALQAELKNNLHKKHVSQAAEQPVCPLCEQDLPLERKKLLQQAFKKRESLLNHQIERLSEIIKNLKVLLVEHNNRIEYLRKTLEQEKIAVVQKQELSKRITKVLEQRNEAEKARLELLHTIQDIQAHCAKSEKEFLQLQHLFELSVQGDSIYQNFFQEILLYEQELTALAYDPLKEQKVMQQLQHLMKVQQAQAELLKESALQEQRKTTIQETIKHLKQLKSLIHTLTQEQAKYAVYKEKEQNILRQEGELAAKLQLITQEKELIIHQKGALEQQCTTIEQRERDHKEQEKTLKSLQQIIEEYTAIASALSKDGIQALLIEDAIPEIEQEANILLSRLTDNQAHLTIESLRDLKNGSTKETLDIKISDPIGIRPYELFSGGEAFRIDFALRIAISKLLARRAGTALQTLIIDEGFGSQDEEGLSHIMEAIHKIQDDFAKVIVVSHLPSLKEQFPVHFLVYKTGQGSTIKIIENG